MSKRFYDYWLATRFKSSRDFVFHDVLSRFQNKPINILEIGAARSTYPLHHERYSDGWSTMAYCDYLYKNGGSITICDIDPHSLKSVAEITEFFKDTVNIRILDKKGEDLLQENNNFDLVYLDGSNNPNETRAQYDLCKKESVILIDDFSIKGTALPHHELTYYLFERGHVMGFRHPNVNCNIQIPEPEDVIKWQGFMYFNNFEQYVGQS